MLRWRFSVRFHLRSIIFGSRGHQIKNYRFSRRWFFINNFFDMRDTKIKMTPSCSLCRAGSKQVLFDLERWSFKFYFRSGQGQIMTHVGQCARPPKWLDKPSGLAPFARLYLYPVATCWRKTDCDLIWPPRNPQSSVAPGASQMGWVAIILKELGGFGRFMRNRKYFHISP